MTPGREKKLEGLRALLGSGFSEWGDDRMFPPNWREAAESFLEGLVGALRATGELPDDVVELVGEVGRSILEASPSPETELDRDPCGPPAGE